MRLVIANAAFRVLGNSYAGFPILLDDDMRIMEPATTFLCSICLKPGRARSGETWGTYGRDLFDFFAYILTNRLNWKRVPPTGHLSVIEAYRDWSSETCKLDAATVNQRLRIVRRFYEWCLEQGIIAELPFRKKDTQTSHAPGFMAHVDGSGQQVQSAEFMLREQTKPLKLLTMDQCKTCFQVLANSTHTLMFRLMLQTGIRNQEVRSFPEKYVFDPDRRADLKGKAKVRIDLDPTDMKLKGTRARSIDVPIPLMRELWWYSVKQRPVRARAGRVPAPRALFLTEKGTAYSKSALQRVFSALRTRVGFPVTPHMLRHSYATYTLHGLRERGYKGDPLIYLRDRLGHSSLTSVMIYVHLLDELDANLILKHEEEINALFGGLDGGQT
jgi:integrase/recombinase XerD